MGIDRDRRCHVLLPPGVRIPAGRLGRRLAALFGEHPLDLSQRLRYGGGWIAQGVSAEFAAALTKALDEERIPYATIPDDCPVSAPVVRPVKRLTFDGSVLELALNEGVETYDFRQLVCVDLVALGESQESMSGEEPAVAIAPELDYPFAAQRRVLLGRNPDTLRPFLHLVRSEPVEFLRIERGTFLPHYAEVMGGLWVDNLLTFLHHLLPQLAATQILPETQRFWTTGELEEILVHKPEELGNRLTWIAEITARELWGDLS